MIFDKIENLRNYASFNSQFNAMAEFIEENDMASLPCGSYEINENVKVNIAEYEPGEGGKFEAHREFHDLQYAIAGGEAIDVIPTENGLESGGYTPDVEFFAGQSCQSTRVALEEGTFAFLAPCDAHKPCINIGYGKIKKAVFKIRIN